VNSPTETVDELRQLWNEFTEKSDNGSRDRLLIHYLPLVKQVAGRMKISLPRSVEYDDLVSTGLMGLINSIDNFNPGRGFKFETYAVPRIRGAILDGLRDVDWMPRSYRQKSRKLERTLTKLINQLGRIPNEDEIATKLGLKQEEYYRFIDQVGSGSLVSLDVRIATGDDGETGSLHDVIPDATRRDPLSEIEESDARKSALKLIDELNDQERSVVALYYYEELTFREIGELLGVSESRVCQIHTRIMAALRVKLRKLLE